MVAKLTGLSESKHGFHIHEYGDCSVSDGASSGGHLNPGRHHHSALGTEMNHAGDLGNITANKKGIAHLEFITNQFSFYESLSIIKRTIIVHADADDLKSQPTGNACTQIACELIEISR